MASKIGLFGLRLTASVMRVLLHNFVTARCVSHFD